jgi:hypothetical protein
MFKYRFKKHQSLYRILKLVFWEHAYRVINLWSVPALIEGTRSILLEKSEA